MNDYPENEEAEGATYRKRHPFMALVAVLVAIGLFFLSIQGYLYLVHPEPSDIPRLSEVQSFFDDWEENAFTSHSPDEVDKVLRQVRDPVKKVANYIVSQSCRKADPVCQSKALFYFVRDNVTYVPDEQFHDQLLNPLSVMKTGGADCEDMAVLLIALQKAIGHETRLVFVPGHAYAQVRIDNYRGGKWLNMEPTCESCKFDELTEDSALKRKTFFSL
jgi:transglutaminase-like putative cysteine protease